MSHRSQSDVIGVVLLTAVITVTVTGVGGVVLTDWQSEIGAEPVVDINSDLTLGSIELEHFGGDAVNASEIVVLVDGGEVAVPLSEFDGIDDQFGGGMEVENDAFDFTPGEYSLRVVHEPSRTVLHSETHEIEFILVIAGEGGPVFMFKEPPIRYTASAETELTLSDDSVIDLDTDAGTITGLRTGEKTEITATDGDRTQTINLTVVEREPLAIETIGATSPAPDTLTLTSDLTEIGSLSDTGIYLRYRQRQPVEFNGDPTNNSDDIIAHGEFYEDPDGYAHGDEWLHDNTPLVPGSNRTYEYIDDSGTPSVYAILRDGPETEETDSAEAFENGIGSPVPLLYNADIPVDERFEVRVEYTDDGDAVNVYRDGALKRTWNTGGYDEIYFSTRENGDSGDDRGLRLLSSPTLSDPQYERVRAGVESPTIDTSEFRSAQPDTVYFVESYTEREISNGIANATGETVRVRTDKLVETRAPTAVGAESVQLEGEVLDSLGETNLSFVVRRSDGTVVANPTVATGVDSPQQFNTTITELEPNSSYVYTARAEDIASSGARVSDTGEAVSFTTDAPKLRTDSLTALGPSRIAVDGAVTDLAGLGELDRYAQYRQRQPVEFNDDPDDNGDDIIAHGEFYEDPDGYAHGDEWLHDNTPLVPGSNRTYEYIDDSGTPSVYAILRDGPETEETDSAEAFENGIGSPVPLLYNADIPVDERFEVRVEYTDDGDAVNVYRDGALKRTWTATRYDEIYFSTRENGDSGDDRGLRLLSSPTLGDRQSQFIRTTTTATTFTDSLSDLNPDTVYFVEVYAERTVNGQTINTTGETLAVRTGT